VWCVGTKGEASSGFFGYLPISLATLFFLEIVSAVVRTRLTLAWSRLLLSLSEGDGGSDEGMGLSISSLCLRFSVAVEHGRGEEGSDKCMRNKKV